MHAQLHFKQLIGLVNPNLNLATVKMRNNILIKFSLCLLAALFYAVGLIFFLTDHEPGDRCEMTYMFEYPQYVVSTDMYLTADREQHLPFILLQRVFHDIDEVYPKYGLYAYGEGRITKKARNMHFDGVPVIFIPGNAGSHHQGNLLIRQTSRQTAGYCNLFSKLSFFNNYSFDLKRHFFFVEYEFLFVWSTYKE